MLAEQKRVMTGIAATLDPNTVVYRTTMDALNYFSTPRQRLERRTLATCLIGRFTPLTGVPRSRPRSTRSRAAHAAGGHSA